MPNDTHANVLLNILFQKYGELPDTYQIVGFDNSPISREAVIPISTVGQQIPVIANEAMSILSGLASALFHISLSPNSRAFIT